MKAFIGIFGTYFFHQLIAIKNDSLRLLLLAIEMNFVKISKGDLSLLDNCKKVGKRSENDNIVPSTIAMMQAIQDLIENANLLASAAIVGDLSVRGDESKFEGGCVYLIKWKCNKRAPKVQQCRKALAD